MIKRLIISAYAVYPEIASSEGIVNKNWIDVLEKNGVETKVISSHKTIHKSQVTKLSKYLYFIYKYYKANKSSFIGVTYKILNKFFKRFFGSEKVDSLYQFLWIKFQRNKLKPNLEISDQVIWSRVLPVFSLLPIPQKENTPLIININDPFSVKEDGEKLTEGKILTDYKDQTQCWTFPSHRLAMYMAEKYKLDKNRCFVIPHAMANQNSLYKGGIKNQNNKKLKYIYTGTFYKSAFTEEFNSGLQRFCKTEAAKEIEFTFILSQYDDSSIQWLREAIPNVKILFKLSREEVLKITATADCVLVLDAITHQDLLKGKFAEAISFGVPIFGVTYQNSVMDSVIKEYGSLSGYQEIENDIFNKLEQTYKNLKDELWLKSFYIKRQEVIYKMSEEYIYQATLDISNYAYDRFLWKSGKIEVEPKSPAQYNWP
ncbi:hypothetical protein [Pseudofulvibacter geojedonensis]|uniref:Uncharacterized protein n=1 Tax=Pseudofulvibacter geojedonensis TaxID=1123758 RepID=A0ABW3HYG5_9FLAO